MKRRAVIAALFALAVSGCASMRGVDTGAGGESYRISVRNNRSTIISVSYSDGATTRQLGEVRPGQAEQFIVVSSTGRVTVYARSSTGASLPAQEVALSSGTTSVTIR